MSAAGRFDRQVRFGPLGERGQARLESASVLLVGCGALGGVLAQTLVRVGVGRLRLVDRDVVELTNLPRQVLFEERHAAERVPKVVAAAESLARIGGPTRIETRAEHVDAASLAVLAAGVDLVLDGTDNLATRYLLNDYSVKHGVPWVYGGVVGASGLVLAVCPGAGACLRCVFPEPPPPGALETCESAGVLLPAVAAVASLQAGLALRLLGGEPAAPEGCERLLQVDVWRGAVSAVAAPRDPACPCCALRSFPFLERPSPPEPTVLCGRRTVQVPRGALPLDVVLLEDRLRRSATRLQRVGPLVRFVADELVVTLFPDGRALVEGTEDPERARSLVERYVGA